jgi:hypothetical protein
MTNKERWERVLKTVEADARRAEALLAAVAQAAERDALTAVAVTEEPETNLAFPTSWRLPSGDLSEGRDIDPVEAFNALEPDPLPPMEEMPPVPHELTDRILAIRARIVELQEELVDAMRQWQPLPVAASATAAAATRSVYVDRRL